MNIRRRHLSAVDSTLIIGSLVLITALSWLYLIDMAAGMRMPSGAMEMGSGAGAMAIPEWNAGYFLMMFTMWTVMMAGMMVPSASPTVLIYAAVARKAAKQQSPVAPTFVFVAGYLFVWTAFSLLATLAQWGLDRLALLSPMMVSSSPFLGAGLLVAAGIYQFLPFKNSCLKNCRSPVDFIARNWRRGWLGALRLGIRHGMYCLGCCWVLMLLLFVGGVMNLLWIAIITIFILLEKVLPFGNEGGKIVGALMILAGFAFLLAAR